MSYANAINAYRVFPRILLIFMCSMLVWIVGWYLSLEDPGAEQSAFASAFSAAAVAFYKFYLDTPKRYLEQKSGE